MPHRLMAVLVGGLLLLPVAAASAAPANVRLRVEGSTQTLVPRTALRTDTRTVNKDGVAGHDCTGTSAAGALEIATAGDWTGSFFAGLGYSVERILGESHAFPDPNFFELWINNRSSATGICQTELQEGDDVLFIVARCDVGPPPDFLCTNPPVLPLGLTVPSTVTPFTPFNVRVVEFASDGTPSPVTGATVEGGDTPVLTGTDGSAAVTVGAAGPRTLVASKAGRARSAAEAVCATTGVDGLCGTTAAVAVDCATNGADGRCGTRDTTKPVARIDGLRDHQRFARGKGPRALRVHVDPDTSGLLGLKLRLTRNDRGRCTYFSGHFERFRRTRGCGADNGFWFAIGDREDTTYLLPRPLPRGHYVLDVNAIDRSFNRDDARRRGGNRIVFDVG